MPFRREGKSDKKKQMSKKKKRNLKRSFLSCRNLHIAGNSFPFSATGSGVQATVEFAGITVTSLAAGLQG